MAGELGVSNKVGRICFEGVSDPCVQTPSISQRRNERTVRMLCRKPIEIPPARAIHVPDSF